MLTIGLETRTLHFGSVGARLQIGKKEAARTVGFDGSFIPRALVDKGYRCALDSAALSVDNGSQNGARTALRPSARHGNCR